MPLVRNMGYLILAWIAAIGFIASVVCHVMGWLQVEPAWGKSLFVLHVGFLVLWIPLVTFANRTMPKGARSNAAHLFAELPPWVGRAVTIFGFYVVLNFVYFIYRASQYPKREVPFYIELRGFSGHWMLFYGVSIVGFVALARLARKRKPDEIAA